MDSTARRQSGTRLDTRGLGHSGEDARQHGVHARSVTPAPHGLHVFRVYCLVFSHHQHHFYLLTFLLTYLLPSSLCIELCSASVTRAFQNWDQECVSLEPLWRFEDFEDVQNADADTCIGCLQFYMWSVLIYNCCCCFSFDQSICCSHPPPILRFLSSPCTCILSLKTAEANITIAGCRLTKSLKALEEFNLIQRRPK